MSIDKSLVTRGRLARHRNVLSRAERVFLLEEEGKWHEGMSVFGLPKVRHIKAKQRRAVKAEAAAAAAPEGAEVATAAAGTAEASKGAETAAKSTEKADKPEKDAKGEKK